MFRCLKAGSISCCTPRVSWISITSFYNKLNVAVLRGCIEKTTAGWETGGLCFKNTFPITLQTFKILVVFANVFFFTWIFVVSCFVFRTTYTHIQEKGSPVRTELMWPTWENEHSGKDVEALLLSLQRRKSYSCERFYQFISCCPSCAPTARHDFISFISASFDCIY